MTFAAALGVDKLQLGWLLRCDAGHVGPLARPGGMRRAGAAVLLILYFAFVAGTLVG